MISVLLAFGAGVLVRDRWVPIRAWLSGTAWPWVKAWTSHKDPGPEGET